MRSSPPNRVWCWRPIADRARAIARANLANYFLLPNYTNNWKRLGFTDDEIAGSGSDRLIDALVALGR